MHPVPTRKTVQQACDACRRRKIKCNGLQPCPGCLAAGLGCTFNIPQKRGGNIGARATVLNELRSAYSNELHGAPLMSPRHAPSPASPHQIRSPGAGGLEVTAIEACIEAYLERIYPVVPFLTREILCAEANGASGSLLSRQFITAFCAYVVGFGNVLDRTALAPYAAEPGIGKQLLDAALRIQVSNRISLPSPQAIFISFFLYGAYASQGDYRQGWFYLREASTLFLLQRGTRESNWFSRRIYGRTFWVLVVSERCDIHMHPTAAMANMFVRSHGIRRNRPITIQITPDSPSLNEPEEIGLHYLASIFRPFDEVFFAIWNGSSHDCSRDWLLSLENSVRTALPPALEVSNEQIANLRVSQLWLQVKLFELSPRFGFLSSESEHECLTFGYPIVLARDLTVLAMKLPIGSLQIHGVGMVPLSSSVNSMTLTYTRRPRRFLTSLAPLPMFFPLFQQPHLRWNSVPSTT
jgi:SP family general alpha glucoside:H+ symporter-like MFS transporter